MTVLVRYDTMCRAIAEAYQVDEVKEIRDQAIALEVYARQAHNVEAERQACEIRLRAERRAGVLLKEREPAKPGPKPAPESGRTVPPNSLRALGITKDQSSDWQKLAAVPEEIFEHQVADTTHKPSTNGIIRSAAEPKPQPVSKEALWLWGRILDFERLELLPRSPADVLATATPEMLEDIHTLAPRVAAWLQLIGRIQ